MPSTSRDRISGLSTSVAVKAPCKAVSTSNLTLYGEQTINGTACVDGDRVLVTGQTNAVENGIWDCSSIAWSRSQDFNGARDVVTGTLIPVLSAAAMSNLWEVSTTGDILIGTTEITFSQQTGGIIHDVESVTLAAGDTLVTFSTLRYVPGVNSILLVVDGLVLTAGVDFSETSTSSVTLDSALPSDATVIGLAGRLTTSGLFDTQISTQSSGTGSAVRTQHDRNEDEVTVLDYMTTAQRADVRAYTGAVDVTGAIQAAHDALPSSGGLIRMPAGAYRIAGAINISKPNVSIRGVGRKATKILQQTAGAKTFNITDEYCTLSNLSIEYASQGTSGGSAVYSAEFYGTFSDLYIKKAHIGFHFAAGGNSNTMERFTVEDFTSVGIFVIGHANVIGSQFQLLCSNTTLGALGAIRLENQVEGCVFSDGQTYQGAYALTTEAATYGLATRPAYNKFNSVFFDSAANGALLNEAVETDFNNCWFSNRPENGIFISTCDGVRFNGGGAVNCAKHGVLVENTCKRVSFVGFSARGNGTAASNTYSGIAIGADTTDFAVQGCTLGGNSALSFGSQKYGIDILAGTSDRYIVADNLVTGNSTAGVQDGGSGSNKRVENNY